MDEQGLAPELSQSSLDISARCFPAESAKVQSRNWLNANVPRP